ncbi:LysR family transcriptional regulator [Alteromonas facilis]|uniref:LysR family transcriptional regulator n=1 Tax=Alteromonas facilis TaxID=2048004 RepID=UPI0013DA2ABE|nr:LysR family transcriptional regulator [Alteromonas facilis]
MDIRFLSTFIEVCKTRHFGRAAENLFITQAAVSARIRSLEEFYETVLFERTRNHIKPTLAGEQLLPFAEQIVSTLKHSKTVIAEQSNTQLNLATTELAGEVLSYALLDVVEKHIEQQQISLNTLSVEALSRQLHERTAAIGISTELPKSEDFAHFAIAEECLALYRPILFPEANELIVQVQYPGKLLDAIQIQFTPARKPHFQTNSLRVACLQANRVGSLVVLPESWVKQQGIEKWVKVATLDADPLIVYASYLKQLDLDWVKEVLASLLN